MTERSKFRLFHRMRVRWAEVDAQQIVFNGHYLIYFDTCVTEYWRAVGVPYPDGLSRFEGDLFVRKATVEYHASARYDDWIDVAMRCERIGNSSITFQCAIFRGSDLLITGELVYVYADPAAGRSLPVPAELREVLQAYEAGEPMVRVEVGDWRKLGADAKAIRLEVFVEEQGIPADLEWDEADSACVHAVAYNRFGLPLATGRMLEHVPGVAKIGRMAVRSAMRGEGVGRRVLDALLDAARKRGDTEALLHAQLSAVDFYSRAGFAKRGPHFEEAGIEHVEMTKPL